MMIGITKKNLMRGKNYRKEKGPCRRRWISLKIGMKEERRVKYERGQIGVRKLI